MKFCLIMKNKNVLLMIFSVIFLTVCSDMIFNSKVLKAQLSPVFNGNKIGYIDSTGAVIIPCLYDTDIDFEAFSINNKMIVDFRIPNMARFNNGAVTVKIPRKFLFYTHGYTYAMLDAKGEYIFEPAENVIYGLSEGIAIYKRLFKTAQKVYDFDFDYIDINHNFITDEAYSFAGLFSEGIALVIDDSGYKYINTKGKKTFEIDVSKIGNASSEIIENFSEGLTALEVDSIFGNINLENINNVEASKIENVSIEMAENFSEGLAAIRVNSLWGYIDTKGNWAILPRFKSAFSFQNGLARVFDGQNFAYINKKGEEITLYEFVFADNFSEGLGLVKRGDKFGYIDTNGKVAIPFNYVYAQSFSEDLAVVFHNGNIVFIDKNGDVPINRRFDYAKGFQYGLAKVWRNDEMFYINKKGETVHQILSRNKYRNKKSAFKRSR